MRRRESYRRAEPSVLEQLGFIVLLVLFAVNIAAAAIVMVLQ